MIPIDLLINARWVIPVEPAGRVLEQHSLAVQGGSIVELLPTHLAQARYRPQRSIELSEHVLIPGLINAHTHAAMTLMRGLADDLPLMSWLQDHIWPTESRHVSPEFVRDGTRLACAEMLRGGITCFNDMYFFPEAAIEAVLESGMRAAVGLIVIEFPSSYATDAEDYLHKGVAVHDRYRDEERIHTLLAPHAPYTISDKTFERIVTLAEEMNRGIHMHVHETRGEIEESLNRYGMRPLERLRHLGLLGPNLLAVHAVHLKEDEIALLARQGCHVAHCPASNMKLASGIAPVARMVEAGINVAIGTDGAASNNRLDMFAEMRLAALLGKAASWKAQAMSAHEVLRMATLNAARALGLEDRIGSLVAGKAADVTALHLREIETEPCYDVASHLVYAAGREAVTHVWAGGRCLLDERTLAGLDTREVLAKAHYWREKLKG